MKHKEFKTITVDYSNIFEETLNDLSQQGWSIIYISRDGKWWEAVLERVLPLKESLPVNVHEALNTAVSAIRFNDDSDYLPALYTIARNISGIIVAAYRGVS